MTKEQEAEILQGVNIAIAEAIARVRVLSILQDLHISIEEKRVRIEETLTELHSTVEKIKTQPQG